MAISVGTDDSSMGQTIAPNVVAGERSCRTHVEGGSHRASFRTRKEPQWPPSRTGPGTTAGRDRVKGRQQDEDTHDEEPSAEAAGDAADDEDDPQGSPGDLRGDAGRRDRGWPVFTSGPSVGEGCDRIAGRRPQILK